MKKRILSILLLCCMVLTMLPTAAFAADEETYALPPDTGSLCEHHPEHDEACGYIPKTAEIPQENEVKIAVLSGTQETVTVESVQAMIDALPEAKNINDDNIEEVKIQFQAVVDAMNQLTVREQNELDISRYMKVSSVLYGPWRDFFNPIPGTDIEWMLSSNDDETLTLTIIGQGEMPDFEDADNQACPWTNSKYAIKRVIIREGVTNIGNYAFSGCAKLAEVHISKTVKKIGIAAFLNCSSLTQIDIPDCVNSVGSFAFIGCTGLKEVHTHWKSSDEINFGLFVFYEYGSSWPEDRIIYVPAGYKANFKSNPNGAWGSWNVQGENYTVSFDGGTASGSMEPVQTSGDYTLPDCSFTYETAVFEYWALENSDGKKAGDAGDVFPVTEDVTFYANWTLVIVIDPDPPIEVCIHEWGEWQSDSNEHWKKCSFCDVVDLRSRRAHDYSDDTDATCRICGYERTITPPAPTLDPPTYSKRIYSGDFCQLAFSDDYLSGGTATADGETVPGVFTLNEEQEKYGYWRRGGGLVQGGPLALKVTFTPYDRLRFSTAECTINVDVIPRKFRQANTSYIDNKKIGTAFEDLGLPNAFYFFAEADEPNHEGSGLNGNVPGIIKWDDSNYDPNSYEEQTIYGEVNRAEFEKYYIVPEGADLRGVVKITLQADPVETEITQPPVFRWKNGDFTLPDNTMFVNRIFEMGATGGGSANLADGVAKVKGTDTVVPGTFSFKEGTPGWFDELGDNVVTVVFTPTDQHSYRTAETTIKVNVIKNTLKRCEEPDPITGKKLGTTFAGLNLPEIVVVEAIDGLRVGMKVSWDESSYDAQSTAWQTIPGTLVFDANDEQKYQQPEPAVTAAIRVKLLGSEDAPAITTTTLPGGTVGTPYHHQLQATGGGFILWELFSGELPDGLTLKQTTGEISGTPTAEQTAQFTVRALNSVGNDKKKLSITIAEAEPPAHEHSYGDWRKDGTNHWHECTDADCPNREESIKDKAAHVYTDDADTTCNVCGYERTVTPPAHEHRYGDWRKDGTNHWHECTDADCPNREESIKDKAAHVYTDDADTTCDTCGYERTITPPAHEHSYGDWRRDGTSHWHECTDADCPNREESIKDKAAHVYTDDADTTCNVCGYERTVTPPAHEHRYGDWRKDGTNHWHECTDADCPNREESIKDKAAHVYTDDADTTCDTCGYERTITPPAPTEFIVTFDGNGGTPSDGSMTTTNQKLTSLPSASRSGSYSFNGWYTEKSGGTKITTDTVFHTNTTVYAHWTYIGGGGGYNPPVTYYTLRFETGGGSDIPSVRETYNAYIDLTQYVPTWRGHTFIGWYSERGLINKVSGVYLTKDMTVYALWRVDENPGTGANPFTDVSEKDWFYGDVMFVYENGLMLGTSKTLFSPHGTATRGMMATILWRMEGSPAPKGKNSFTDAEAGKWYADAITWTAENGIFAGYGKDKFGPDDPITREQLAAIFYRYADYKGYDLTVKGNPDTFKDADKITDYAKTAMQWTVGSGLVKGKSGNLLDPQGTATRAEIAAMLHRFIEKYELVQDKAPGGLMG